MRLCVETPRARLIANSVVAAASVRLCVETEVYFQDFEKENAAASVRLCVETIGQCELAEDMEGSRLRAAVC